MQIKKHFLLLVLLINTLFVVSNVYSNSLSGGEKKKSKLTEHEEISLINTFVEANKEKMIGNNLIAETLFLKCLEIDPNHDASLYELSYLYLSRQSYDE